MTIGYSRIEGTMPEAAWLREKAQELRTLARRSHRDHLLYLALSCERLARCAEVQAARTIPRKVEKPVLIRTIEVQPPGDDNFGFFRRPKRSRLMRWFLSTFFYESLAAVHKLAARLERGRTKGARKRRSFALPVVQA